MKERYYNEENGLWYERKGDYYLPILKLPQQPDITLGRYARMHKAYLLEKKKPLYYTLLTQVKLAEYLHDVEERALDLENTLTKQMAAQEDVTEALKAKDMMEWVRRMNNIKNRVREIVMEEVIFN